MAIQESSVPSAWLSESDDAALVFSRPNFATQLTICLQAVKTVLGRVDRSITSRSCKALQHVGHSQPVMALSAIPKGCIPVVDNILQNFVTGSFSAACRRKFDPVCVPFAIKIELRSQKNQLKSQENSIANQLKY